jgi:hypothetical protein
MQTLALVCGLPLLLLVTTPANRLVAQIVQTCTVAAVVVLSTRQLMHNYERLGQTAQAAQRRTEHVTAVEDLAELERYSPCLWATSAISLEALVQRRAMLTSCRNSVCAWAAVDALASVLMATSSIAPLGVVIFKSLALLFAHVSIINVVLFMKRKPISDGGRVAFQRIAARLLSTPVADKRVALAFMDLPLAAQVILPASEDDARSISSRPTPLWIHREMSKQPQIRVLMHPPCAQEFAAFTACQEPIQLRRPMVNAPLVPFPAKPFRGRAGQSLHPGEWISFRGRPLPSPIQQQVAPGVIASFRQFAPQLANAALINSVVNLSTGRPRTMSKTRGLRAFEAMDVCADTRLIIPVTFPPTISPRPHSWGAGELRIALNRAIDIEQ